MFATLFSSIFFSALVVTSAAAGAGLIAGVDGNDRSVVTKQVVRIAKACPAGETRDYCTVDVKAYSRYNSASCNGANEGFVKLNGKTVWSAGFCSSLDNSRGITIVNIDTHSCTANSVQTFDTHERESNAVALSAHLQQLPPGAVIVGVTGDEPTSELGPALGTLKSMRVDLADVPDRGNFAFVLQKDYSFKPIVAKGRDVNAAPATINVRLAEECRILLQQHAGGTTYFNRSWTEYKYGFGVETGNYWIGNDRLYNLTVNGNFKLRVDVMSKYNSEWYWAEYETFRVMDESSNYVLWVTGYSGTAGDAMSSSNGIRFTTRERDVDTWCGGNCASERIYGNSGGFWYGSCGLTYVNSPILDGDYWGFGWYSLPINGPFPDAYKLTISRMYLVMKDFVP